MLDPNTCGGQVHGLGTPQLDKKGNPKKDSKGNIIYNNNTKKTKNPKRGNIQSFPSGGTCRGEVVKAGGICIDNDKIINDFSELYIENTINGKGNGSFRKINLRDFVCYDLNSDIYGIAWLMDPDATYIANKISGKLYANKINQSVNFSGSWETGKFNGRNIGSRLILPGSQPSQKDVQKKFEYIQNLIKSIKIDFDQKFKEENNQELIGRTKSSDNDKLKDLLPDFLKIQKYLSNIIILQSMGGSSSYIKSPEIYRIKEMIQNKEDSDDIMDEINALIKEFKIIQSKIDKFYTEYQKLPISNQSGPNTGGSGKKAKKTKF
jgi:hypothetical protein